MVGDVTHRTVAQIDMIATDGNSCSRGSIFFQQNKSGKTKATTVRENDWPLMPQETKRGP